MERPDIHGVTTSVLPTIRTIIARIQRASMLNRHSDSKNMILGNFRKRA